MSKLNRRAFIAKSGLVGASVLAGSFGFPSLRAAESEVLRIGYLPITDAAPLLVAYAMGFFKEEGVKAVRPRLIRNWSSLSEAFISNHFNITHLLFPIPIWMRYNNKIPVKILAWDHTNGSAITVKRDSNIKDFSDLAGKQVAVPYWYSMHNMILQMGLRNVGLKPVIKSQSETLKSNEVNLFILPPPEMPLALMGNKIDAYIVAEPFNALAELKIKAKIMRFVGDIWQNHPCCVVVAKEKLIQQNPVFTGKVVQAITRAQLWISQNRDAAARLLSKKGSGLLPQNETILKQALSNYSPKTYATPNGMAIKHPDWKINRVDFQPYPYPSATRLIIEQMKKTRVEGKSAFLNNIQPDFVVNDLVDDRFVKAAIENLGGLKTFGKYDYSTPWGRKEIIEF